MLTVRRKEGWFPGGGGYRFLPGTLHLSEARRRTSIFHPRRPSGQALVTGVAPPPGTCVLFYHAKESAFPLPRQFASNFANSLSWHRSNGGRKQEEEEGGGGLLCCSLNDFVRQLLLLCIGVNYRHCRYVQHFCGLVYTVTLLGFTRGCDRFSPLSSFFFLPSPRREG